MPLTICLEFGGPDMNQFRNMCLPVSRVWREEEGEDKKKRKTLPRFMGQFDGGNLLGCRGPTKEKQLSKTTGKSV